MNVLIITGGKFHPFEKTTKLLSDWLSLRRQAKVKVAQSSAGINEENLNWADVIIINHQGNQEGLSEPQGQMLENFVQSGKGLVGIHSAADSFRENKTYLNLIGCEFVTHGPPAEVRINFTNPSHQITAHTENNFAIFDEIYQCKIHGSPKILATVRWEGKEFPMITVNNIGKGRVFYIALGHDETSWSNENFQTLLIRGIDWTYKGDIKKEIGCGLLGVGPRFGMGEHHGQKIIDTFGLKLISACDINQDNLDRIKTKFDWLRTTTKLDKFLADDDLELITIITPHNTHYDLAKKCLSAGKNVILEKPFVLKYKEAEELIRIAEDKGVMLTCYQNRRWDWQYLWVKKIIDSGRIGKPFYARITMGSYRMPEDAWRAYKEISGGQLYDWGAHHIDWILNWIDSEPKSVFAATQKLRWFWCTNEDHTNLTIKFDNGTVAEYMTTTLYPAYEDDYIIVAGTEGTIKVSRDPEEAHIIKFDENGKKISEEILPGIEHGNLWYKFYHNIADHLLFGEPLKILPEQSAKAIKVIESAYISADENKVVEL